MTKLYANAVLLVLLAAVASVLFAGLAGNSEYAHLQKAAFIFGTALAGGFLSAGMTFVTRQTGDGRRWTLLNLNVLTSVASALCVLGGLVALLDVSIFTDMVAEGVAGSIAGSVSGIIMAFAKADNDGED